MGKRSKRREDRERDPELAEAPVRASDLPQGQDDGKKEREHDMQERQAGDHQDERKPELTALLRKSRQDDDKRDGQHDAAPAKPSDEEDEKNRDNMYCRTFLLSLLAMTFSMGLVWAVLMWNLWAAGAAAFLTNILLSYLMPGCFMCVYGSRSSSPRLRLTLSQCVLIGTFFGGFSTLFGGFWLRQYYITTHYTTYRNVDPAIEPPVTNIGTITFSGLARPYPNLGARAVSQGLFWTCVAPVLRDESQPTVAYWAVGHGGCCTQTIPNCEFWDRPAGGSWLKYTEIYPAAADAVQSATSHFGKQSHPNAQFLLWYPPEALQADYSKTGSLIVGCGASFGFLLMTYRAIRYSG